jgi:hypothetical protein
MPDDLQVVGDESPHAAPRPSGTPNRNLAAPGDDPYNPILDPPDPIGPSSLEEGRLMAWIHMIPEDEAEGELRDLYRRLLHPSAGGGERGLVDHVLKIHSLNPPSLRTHYELYRALMYGPSPLSRVQRETLAVAVSAANECHY